MSLLEPPKDLLDLLHESLPDSITTSNDGTIDTSGTEDILAYVAFLAAGLCEVQDFSKETWTDVLQPYLETIEGGSDGSINLDEFRENAEKATLDQDDADSYGGDDDGEFEEVCNLRFKYVVRTNLSIYQIVGSFVLRLFLSLVVLTYEFLFIVFLLFHSLFLKTKSCIWW